jgi:hypothetical protein
VPVATCCAGLQHAAPCCIGLYCVAAHTRTRTRTRTVTHTRCAG